MSEEAKAAQEVAKATGKAMDAVTGFGKFLDRVFGNAPTDAVGIYGDKLKARRFVNCVQSSCSND